MGYVKIAKANGQFDLLPADTGIDSDDQKIIRAIEKMNGASAPGIFPEALSVSLVSSTNLAIA
jgi:hypothetical protein